MSYFDALIAFAAYCAAINLLGFMVTVWDAESARSGARRVSEQFLLALALVGGSVGVIAGLRFWRHKTRKGSFLIYLRMIVIIQVTVLIGLAFPDARNTVWELWQQTPG